MHGNANILRRHHGVRRSVRKLVYRQYTDVALESGTTNREQKVDMETGLLVATRTKLYRKEGRNRSSLLHLLDDDRSFSGAAVGRGRLRDSFLCTSKTLPKPVSPRMNVEHRRVYTSHTIRSHRGSVLRSVHRLAFQVRGSAHMLTEYSSTSEMLKGAMIPTIPAAAYARMRGVVRQDRYWHPPRKTQDDRAKENDAFK